MTITFNQTDRMLLMKRFRAAMKDKYAGDIVTVLHITEVIAEQRME